jgi:hypothetical protein
MTKIAKIIVFCALALSLPLGAAAQRSGYVISAKNAESAVSEKFVRDAVKYLSAESLGGRAAGTPGGAAAASWIDLQFREAGLENIGGTYLYGFRNSGTLCRNVIGVIPGTSSRVVILMAHFDNYGKLGDTFFPGADSNASGVAAMLQIARMFKRMKECHKSYGATLVFVALDAKEKDLAGAADLWSRINNGRLGFAPEDISLVVNLDQLGSSMSPITKGNPDYLMMLSEESNGRRSTLVSAEKTQHIGLELGFDYYGSKDFTKLFYRTISDQRIFLEHGIPSVMFTSGITMLNNKPGDTADTLDYPVLMKRIRLIFYYLDKIL